MKIVESKLSNLISECFVEVLQEDYMQDRIKEKTGSTPFDVDEAGRGGDPTTEMVNLIAQVNQAYHQNQQRYGDSFCLLDKSDGGFYGLARDVVLSRGSVVIVTTNPYSRNQADTERIPCFRTIRGKVVKYIDEFSNYGDYKWAKKRLKEILRDAALYNSYNDEQNMLPGDDEKAEMKLDKKYGLGY